MADHKVAPLTPTRSLPWARCTRAYLARAATAEPGSTLQHAAFQAAVETRRLAGDAASAGSRRRARRASSSTSTLRWRMLARWPAWVRSIRPSSTGTLAAEPTAVSTVEHARAVGVAARPPRRRPGRGSGSPGVDDVPNYELEAAGQGMWRPVRST